jgi:bifunctional N-acetylglucosamine-1-phosphate-uridyltransferase/glucosamine-1-phosphate-acetyltransferase GlmU-like protein
MPKHATTAILFADDAPMPGSLAPLCLEEILGDAILLWQLRALPEEIERVHVIAGDRFGAVAELVAGHRAETNRNAECHESRSVPKTVLHLLETGAVEPGATVLLVKPNRPLVGAAAVKALLDNGHPGALLKGCEMALLDGERLKFYADLLVGRKPDADSDRLLSEALSRVTTVMVNCDQGDAHKAKTRRDLAHIQGIARKRIVDRWLDAGVAFVDPDSAHIGPRVAFADRGVTIEPCVRIEGKVAVGEGTTIGQGSAVRDSTIGANAEVRPYCVITGASIGDGARIGPFARLREGSRIDRDVHLGNFVETKDAHMHPGAKANHLSYLGDCEVGEKTNIGAGCITCNYDGLGKRRTVLGKNVFVGSDCQLVAPVAVGDGAVLAAGTTLTADVPEDALVLARPVTTVKEGGASRLWAKLEAERGQTAAN